ncbi:gliding motility-associated lipoprotein GldB [Pontibacter ummariensis]|uniref:Gliding motility-associated lipoprotein GldB n=1 Tax=Pontibacter ummariensis TaxID=1610492 RepID=A0A239JJT3_9BACT|nr:gliding motility lipoprotein GldB [Pontibacter ummariensis]PRY07854.1 gliding motility-associated lipoprotein GldB [Pontibacter ummariensis]SNT06141.1 gliding motility-associated lipoprotein GldB [Pontibacter ummariensis]
MYYRLFLLVTLLFAFGCGNESCELPEEIAEVPVDVEVQRMEVPFFAADSKQEIAAFLAANPLFAERYLQLSGEVSDSAAITPLYELATNEALDSLVQQAVERFEEMEQEEQILENAFKVIKYHYPDYHVPEVKTFVTGLGTLGNDLFISDSLIVFGLDYFIGKNAKYRPQVYEYILERYDREYMVPAAMLLLSNRFNQVNNADRTLLGEMISAGKAYYFVQSVLPCAPDSLIIGYSEQEIADIFHNEGRIWAHFIEKELLYEKSPFLVNKYIGERPNTPEIDASAPGRLGTWVGWQIVRKYMERNPEVTLPELMAETDYRKIFNESRYKPEKR